MVNDDDRIEKLTRALRVDGPAPIPEGLAARAVAAAMASSPSTTIWDELRRLAPVAFAASAACAIVAAFALRAAPATTTTMTTTTASTSWSVVTDDELATALFGGAS